MTTILPGTELYDKYRHMLVREVGHIFFSWDRVRPGQKNCLRRCSYRFGSGRFSAVSITCPALPLPSKNLTRRQCLLHRNRGPLSEKLSSLGIELGLPIIDLFSVFWKPDCRNKRRKPLKAALTPGTCLVAFRDFRPRCLAGRDSDLSRLTFPNW